MDQGTKALDLAVTGTECGYEAQSANPTVQEVEHVGDIRKAAGRDALMREIQKLQQGGLFSFISKLPTHGLLFVFDLSGY